MTPKVSIIIPNFNKEKYLPETLQSVIDQEFQHWEAIVIDDNSTDDSLQIIQEFQQRDERIKLIAKNEDNRNGAVSRNMGINAAKSTYIVFLDSDDLLATWALKKRVGTLDNLPNHDFIVFQSLLFLEEPYDLKIYSDVETSEADVYRALRLEVPWTISSPIWRRSSLIKLGLFNENLTSKQDPDLMIKALISGYQYDKFFDLKPDFFYRQLTGQSVSNMHKSGKRNEMLANEMLVLQSAIDLLLQEKNHTIDLSKALTCIGARVIIIVQQYLQTNAIDLADQTAQKGKSWGCFDKKSFSTIMKFVWIRRRGVAFPGLYRLMNFSLSRFYFKNHWGQFKMKMEHGK